MFRLSLLIFLTTAALAPAQLATPAVRAAYTFPFGNAYSAAVEKPSCTIIDLGPDVVPLDVNDSLSVLLRSGTGDLIRWKCGQKEILHNFAGVAWATMNEEHSVVQIKDLQGTFELSYWPGLSATPTVLDWTVGLLAKPTFLRPFRLNDRDFLAVRRESEDLFSPFAPHTVQRQSSLLDLQSGTWQTLSRYESTLGTDFVLEQGGKLFEIEDLNNHLDTVGYLYEDHATSSPFSPEPTYAYQHSYYTVNMDTVLDFDPLEINDHGTVIGRTEGPDFDLVVLDAFGERVISPAVPNLGSQSPRFSNPADGMEEIVMGKLYWKRKTERDLRGQPTGAPSPDFWQGTIADIVPLPGSWTNLKATCISANGRVAGTGFLPDPATGSLVSHGFVLLPPVLIPDWDRDGVIGMSDKSCSARGLSWRIWINDDADQGDLARSAADDLPAGGSPNSFSPTVDGRRDVVDFFPLQLDIQEYLQSFSDLSEIDVRLSHADKAVNILYTSLDPSSVGTIHTTDLPAGFGTALAEPLLSATTIPLGAAGHSLERSFLKNIKHHGRGVLLVEASRSSTSPIVMDFRYKDRSVFTASLPVSTSPVKDMFRIINLRNCDTKFSNADPGPWLTDASDPPNLPDAYLKEFANPIRTLVHVHGFNWGGDEIPSAHAEIFKRFYQCGSHARFIGVSWFGDQGTLELTGSSFDYNENVINAFITASYLSSVLAPFSGPFTSLLAHSLGNMVASSAIVDHGLDVDAYFMLNAAVPSEAYSGESFDRRLMVHPEWKDTVSDIPDYADRLLAANWHRLFPINDRRRFLAWKERFASISGRTRCFNFYSSGEDILRKGNGDLPSLTDEIWDRELIWVYNEMNKGTSTLTSTLTGDIHGGWGFNRHYMDWYDPGGPAHPPSGDWVPMSPLQAESLTSPELVAHPFFRPFSSGDEDFPLWFDGQWLYGDAGTANQHLPEVPLGNQASGTLQNHAKILAEAIPAHSSASGTTSLDNLLLLANHDLDTLYRDEGFWPARNELEKENRWLHSDYLGPALMYVSGFYLTCTEYINRNP